MKLLRSSRSSEKETNELTNTQSYTSIAPIKDKRLSMIQSETITAIRPQSTKFKSGFFDKGFDASSGEEEEKEKRKNFAFNSVTSLRGS